jgi:hypothetical protein
VHHGAKIDDLPIYSDEYATAQLDSADMILLSSGGSMDYIKDKFDYILNNTPHANKVVFIDGHDSNAYLIDPGVIGLYLKRELRYPEATYIAWPNVFGFTFGVYDFHFDNVWPLFNDRPIDVAFVAFGGSSPLRSECQRILTQYGKANPKLNIVVSAPNDCQPYSIDDYRKMMRSTKVMVSIPGAGIDTLRFWEAMGFGAVLLSCDIAHSLYVRNLPEPRRHAFYFDNWQRMIAICDTLVSDPVRWRHVRQSADSFIVKHHSTKARALELIELFNSAC